MHHIISDGWSTGVLIKELVGLYEAFSLGKPFSTSRAINSICRLYNLAKSVLPGRVIRKSIRLLEKQQLKNLPIQITHDYPRPDVSMYRGAKQTLTLNLTLIAAIKSLSLREGTTIFMTLLAAFKAVLHYYSGHRRYCSWY